MIIVSATPKILENYNASCSATESNKPNPQERTFDLPFFFRYKHITSLKKHLSLARSERLPCWFRDNFCGCVCFDSLVDRISFVSSH